MKLLEISTKKHPDTFTTLDDDDYEWASQWKWTPAASYNTVYAIRISTIGGIRQTILLHRLIMKNPTSFLVDHINRNGLDNRKANLRLCNARQSVANRGKQKKPASSRFVGVYATPYSTFSAGIKIEGRTVYLGSFRDEVSAALAYDATAKAQFGEFAFLNIPGNEGVS